ncbi:hypothetical protein NKG94_47470 [Micromonospora sp. M12]
MQDDVDSTNAMIDPGFVKSASPRSWDTAISPHHSADPTSPQRRRHLGPARSSPEHGPAWSWPEHDRRGLRPRVNAPCGLRPRVNAPCGLRPRVSAPCDLRPRLDARSSPRPTRSRCA